MAIKNCECGSVTEKGSHLCYECRDIQLRKVMIPWRGSALNRSDEGSEAPISNDVLCACRGRCGGYNRVGEAVDDKGY